MGRLPQVSQACKGNREDDATCQDCSDEIGCARFLRSPAGRGIAAVTLGGALGGRGARSQRPGTHAARQIRPRRHLELLKEGNARFVEGNGLTADRLYGAAVELTSGRGSLRGRSGAVRIPALDAVSIRFRVTYSVRVAGNFVTIDGLRFDRVCHRRTSHAPLIVVLGHGILRRRRCRRSTYVREAHANRTHHGPRTAIEPAVKSAQGRSGDWLAQSIARNVCDTSRP